MTLDIAATRQDMLAAGDELIAEHLEVGAVVLECTNMVPFARTLRQAANAGLRRAEPARLGLPGDPLERPRRRSVARAAPPVRSGRCYSLSSAAPLASSA